MVILWNLMEIKGIEENHLAYIIDGRLQVVATTGLALCCHLILVRDCFLDRGWDNWVIWNVCYWTVLDDKATST